MCLTSTSESDKKKYLDSAVLFPIMEFLVIICLVGCALAGSDASYGGYDLGYGRYGGYGGYVGSLKGYGRHHHFGKRSFESETNADVEPKADVYGGSGGHTVYGRNYRKYGGYNNYGRGNGLNGMYGGFGRSHTRYGIYGRSYGSGHGGFDGYSHGNIKYGGNVLEYEGYGSYGLHGRNYGRYNGGSDVFPFVKRSANSEPNADGQTKGGIHQKYREFGGYGSYGRRHGGYGSYGRGYGRYGRSYGGYFGYNG